MLKKDYIIGAVAILAIVLAVVALVGGKQSVSLPSVGGTTNYDSLTLGENLIVGGTMSITGATTFTGAATFSGLSTLDAGLLNSYTKSTTTSATSYTLTAADILNYSTIIQTLSGGAATFTLPATSTITTMIPTAGDSMEQCWLPLTNNLTFAAGTGIDLETSSSSPTDLTILASNTGCVKYIRQANTDIKALLTEYTDAD